MSCRVQLLVVILISFFGANATDNTLIRGQIVASSGELPKALLIGCFYDQKQVDTVKVDMYGSFTYQVKQTVPSLYRLQFGFSSYNFFVKPNEGTLRLNIVVRDLKLSSAAIEDYKENNAYIDFNKLLESYDIAMMQAIQNKQRESFIDTVLHDFNSELNRFSVFYKGTYVVDKLVKLRLFDVNQLSNVSPKMLAYSKVYFNSVDFKDTTLFATPIFPNMIDFFSNVLVKAMSPQEREDAISSLLKKASVLQLNYVSVAERLFEGGLNSGNDDLMVGLVTRINSEGDSTVIPVLKEKAKRLSGSIPGKKFMDVTYTNNINAAPLADIVKKNKYTLLVFWESTCKHCRQTMPVVKKVYDEFHLKGFDVVAVSLDEDTTEWKKFLQEQDFKFNLANIKQPNDAVNSYFVTQLPTLILINQEGIIEKRLSPISDIGDYLDEKLK